MKLEPRAFPIVISGPSGVGKSTFVARILEDFPEFEMSVSLTTRARRGEERDGVDYRFVAENEFRGKIDSGELVEWAEVHGALYGTPAEELERNLDEGTTVLLELDVQGGRNIKRAFPGALLIFILPPDPGALAERLEGRGTETEEAIRLRLRNAADEIRYAIDYDAVVVNDDRERAGDEVLDVVRGERHRRARILTGEEVEALAREYESWVRGEPAPHVNLEEPES